MSEVPLAFSHDGRTLATDGAEQYSVASRIGLGMESWRLFAQLGPLRWILLPLFRRGEPAVHLWDVSSGQLKTTLTGATQTVAFPPGGNALVTGVYDAGDTSRLWDVQTGQPMSDFRGLQVDIRTVARSPDGSTFATGQSDGVVHLWDLFTGQLKATLDGHRHGVRLVAFSPDGNTLASSGEGSVEVRIWDVRSGAHLVTLEDLKGMIHVLAFSPDGKTLATGVELIRQMQGRSLPTLGKVQLWDVATGQLKTTLPGPLSGITAFAFSPDGRILATGGGQWRSFDGDGNVINPRPFGEVHLHDTSSGRLKATLTGHGAPISSLVFSLDGKVLATGDSVGATRLWEVESGRLRPSDRAMLSGESRVDAIAFSPDGRLVATGGRYSDVTVRLWNVRTGGLETVFRGQQGQVQALAFSSDSKTLAIRDGRNQVRLWNTGTGQQIPVTALGQLARFPPEIVKPSSPVGDGLLGQPALTTGDAASLYDPRDGRMLASMMSLPPEAAPNSVLPRPGDTGLSTKAGVMEAETIPTARGGEWFVMTPEGYFDCSANAARFIRWNVNGVLYPAERYLRLFRRPDLVRKALRGERITAPALSANDIPPTAQFVGLQNGDPAPGDPLTVTVEARDDQDVKEVELLVNGRPLPPEEARPIEVGAKPIEVGAKDVDPNHRIAKRFTFHFSLPLGVEEIQLRAIAYDTTNLGSDPVEIVLKRAGARPVTGNLYVLAVGVSRYQHADGQRLRNLRFPAADAQAIAQRFQREGKPLYEQVHVRTLTDEQATLPNVRAELKWLQERARPGQIDTVVIFLSGHGTSHDGRYYFGTHDLDLQKPPDTSLSGTELKVELGGKLQAKRVFLFVDTCHAGGLGGRNDDLSFELEARKSIYFMASSGAMDYAYEAPQWGHGAFTLALLRALNRTDLAREGMIYFNVLPYVVPDEVATLMREAGRNETEQAPCIPQVLGPLRVPIVLAPQ
jgi:WD40 repeat protein